MLEYVYKYTCNIDEMWRFANLWIPWIVAINSLALDKMGVYRFGICSDNIHVWFDRYVLRSLEPTV